VQERIIEIVQELRVFCGELRPPTLTPFGLESTIQAHAEAFNRQHPEIELRLDLQPDGQMLPERVRLALFRIYQQAMANMLRHSGANRVAVRFNFDAEQALLEIEDNGKGFSVPSRWIDLVREGHLGLAGSAERAEAVGGKIQVESAPGRGTLLRAAVPF
jgi:signal transduction histidine kinase